jgi:hypothetical protein
MFEVGLRRSVKNPKQWADVESHPPRNEGWGNREIVLILIGECQPGL